MGTALFFPPDEWILGALDPGAYVNTGAIIARTGTILAPDPFLASLAPAIRDGLLPAVPATRLPGLYRIALRFNGFVPSGFYLPTDHIVPHGFHFYPTVLAFGYALGGIWPELYVTPVLAVAGLVAGFLLWRRLFGVRVATIATSLLAVCSAEVWFARYPDAEMLAQLLLFGGLFAFVVMLDTPSRWPALIAGSSLGALHLTKIETLPLPFLVALFFGYEIVVGQFKRVRLWFVIPYAALGTQAAFHAIVFSSWYTASSFGRTLSPRAIGLVALITFGVVTAFAAVIFLPPLRARARAAVQWHLWLPVRANILPGTIVALALFAYYVRPLLVDAATTAPALLSVQNDAASLVRLGWYIGPFGVLLATLGWALIARNVCDRRAALPLVVVAVDTLIYLDQAHITPIHYWAARRWATDVIPGACLAAAYLLVWLWPKTDRPLFDALLPIGMGAFTLFGVISASLPLIGYVEYRGAIQQLSTLASTMPSDAIVLFADGDSGERFSTPLQYLFGRRSLVVWPAPDAYAAANAGATEWLAQGTPVYWVNTRDVAGPDRAGLLGQIVARQHVALAEKIEQHDVPPGADGLFQQDVLVWKISSASLR
jgi:hypothetical protein